jgi:nucleotide-binding universal stress UspA family protein
LASEAVDFLDLHGIKATPVPIPSTMSADKVIIAQVEEIQPRLLVMGAYGQSIWREFVFGSTTTRLLEASPVPLLLCR